MTAIDRNMRDLVGTVIGGRYKLESYLDEGGFGAVYRASQTAYGCEMRTVAVKLAKRPMTDKEARDAFGDALLMVKIVGRSLDPSLRQHFVTVHDAGRCGDDTPIPGHPYVVMEFLDGGSVDRQVRQGSFPLKRATNYFDQMLKAIAFMHTGLTDARGEVRPVVHRDLKPANVLVTLSPSGQDVLKITDFGLAVEVDQLLDWSESSGDLAYMAPESFTHKICSLQSDVYSLALTFYEMLMGTNPFREVGAHLTGTQQQKHEQLCRVHHEARKRENFQALRSHPEIKQAPAIGDVILEALHPNAAERPFKHAEEFQRTWHEVCTNGAARLTANPIPAWDKVRYLEAEASAALNVGDLDSAERALRQAVELNNDERVMSRARASATASLSLVELLLERGDDASVNEAGQLANQAYRKKPSRASCTAMARYFQKKGSSSAAEYVREANQYPSEER